MMRPASISDGQRGVVVVGLVGFCVALLAAGCGGGSPSRSVASVASTGSATNSNPTPGTPFDKYSACMRSHGVPQFPDPTNNGRTLNLRVGPGQAVDPESPQYRSAQDACSSLVPGGSALTGHTITPAETLDYLRAAACVRAHGVAGFPDPTITNGHVRFTLPQGIGANSPRVQKAIAVCRKLIPAGLPYGN